MTNFVKDGDNGIGISHHTVGDGYAKVYELPAGIPVEQHKHKLSHDAHLILGVAVVVVDGVSTEYKAPAVINIEAGKVHMVLPITPSLWACVWPDVGGITDPDLIDHELVL